MDFGFCQRNVLERFPSFAYLRAQISQRMKKVTFLLGFVAAAAAFTGCEEPLACEEGNKATLTVYNYTACTPTIEVDGDVVPGGEDLNATFLVDVPGDSVVIELDEGTYNVSAELSFITLCTERDTTIETMCGGNYTWNFY